MVDAMLRPRSAFDDLAPLPSPSTSIAEAGLRVAPRSRLQLARIAARAGRQVMVRDRLKERYGLDLPDGPRRTTSGPITAVGVAPGAWLIVAESSDKGSLVAELAEALANVASVVDQSSSCEILRLGGRALRGVLAKGVALDFHPEAFGLDAAAVTLAEQVNVILWRVDAVAALELDIAVPRSYFGAFWSWLTDSAAAVGLALET